MVWLSVRFQVKVRIRIMVRFKVGVLLYIEDEVRRQ